MGAKLTSINTKHADLANTVDDQVKKVDWNENIVNSVKIRVTEFGKKFKDLEAKMHKMGGAKNREKELEQEQFKTMVTEQDQLIKSLNRTLEDIKSKVDGFKPAIEGKAEQSDVATIQESLDKRMAALQRELDIKGKKIDRLMGRRSPDRSVGSGSNDLEGKQAEPAYNVLKSHLPFIK